MPATCVGTALPRGPSGLLGKELARWGWSPAELAVRRKSDPAKMALAARLRQETTLTIKAIAVRLHLGTSKSANARLPGCPAGCEARRWRRPKRCPNDLLISQWDGIHENPHPPCGHPLPSEWASGSAARPVVYPTHLSVAVTMQMESAPNMERDAEIAKERERALS